MFGNPAIASGREGASCRFITDSDGDGDWTDESNYETGLGNYPSLAFDALNRPMVAGYDKADAAVCFAMATPDMGWFSATVDVVSTPDDVESGYPSLAIDPDTDFPGIAYYDELNGDLKYAGWDGDQWIIDVLDSTGDTGLYPSLAFDPADGNPAIAYFDADNTSLKLAFHDGGSWQIQTVDDVGDVGYCPSLAFNDYGTGFPSIAYFNATDTLYFIEDPLVPEPATLALLLSGAIVVLARRRRGAR